MSENRTTTTIENVTLPEPEPVVTLADLYSQIDWNFTSTNLNSNSQPLPAVLSDPAVSMLLCSPVITVPLAEAESAMERLKALAAKGSSADILRYGRELAVARQERLLTSSLNILRESCLRAGFTEVNLHPSESVLVALQPGTTQRAVIEIERAPRGQVGVNFDMHGFQGDACIDREEAIMSHASELGLKLDTRNRKRKTDSPVVDRRRLPDRNRNVAHQG